MLRSCFVPRFFLAPRTVEQLPLGTGFPVLPSRRSLWRATSADLLVRKPAPEAQASRSADGRFHRPYSYPVARDGDTLDAPVRSAQRHRHGGHADQAGSRTPPDPGVRSSHSSGSEMSCPKDDHDACIGGTLSWCRVLRPGRSRSALRPCTRSDGIAAHIPNIRCAAFEICVPWLWQCRSAGSGSSWSGQSRHPTPPPGARPYD